MTAMLNFSAQLLIYILISYLVRTVINGVVNSNTSNENSATTTSTTTTTTQVTETRIVNGNSAPIETTKVTKITNGNDQKSALIKGGNEIVPKMQNGTSSKTEISTIVTNGQLNGHDGTTKIVTTTVRTVANGYSDDGKTKVIAKGKADVVASKAAAANAKTIVASDGTIVTTGESTKVSSTKYAVEASTVQEKTITYR